MTSVSFRACIHVIVLPSHIDAVSLSIEARSLASGKKMLGTVPACWPGGRTRFRSQTLSSTTSAPLSDHSSDVYCNLLVPTPAYGRLPHLGRAERLLDRDF